jgi:hypothetical protein
VARTAVCCGDCAWTAARRVPGAAFDAAIQANPYVVSYLLDPDSIPFDRPPHFALHSREEAAYVAETLADAFAATDCAREWLAAQAWRFSPGSRRGRRDP